MNAIRRIEHGAAAGVLVTMSGIGATFGVALSGSFFQSVQDSTTDELLSKLGIGLTEAQERTLSGVLAGNPDALAELHTFPPGQQAAIEVALKQGFTDGLGVVMWLSLGVAVAGMIVVRWSCSALRPCPTRKRTLHSRRPKHTRS
jgi:hypothetical protein